MAGRWNRYPGRLAAGAPDAPPGRTKGANTMSNLWASSHHDAVGPTWPEQLVARLRARLEQRPGQAMLLALAGVAGVVTGLLLALRPWQAFREYGLGGSPNPWEWAGVAFLLLLGVTLGYVLYPHGPIRLLLTAAVFSALLLPILAVIEAGSVAHSPAHPAGAFLRYTLLLLVAGVCLLTSGSTINRLLRWLLHWRDNGHQDAVPGTVPAGAGTATGEQVWVRNTVLPGMRPGERPDQGGSAAVERFRGRGIGVSGGGIRSAVFALGGLNALRDRGELRRTDVLAAVSGGGYLTGAMRLALQDPPDEARKTSATAADVFADGSPETDHLRRHGRYLADSPGEWMAALLVVARGVLWTIGLLLLAVLLAGQLLGYAGRTLLLGPASPAGAMAGLDALWPPPGPVIRACAAVTVLAGGTWLVSVVLHSRGFTSWAALVAAWAAALGIVTSVAATLGIVLPAVVRLGEWLPDRLVAGWDTTTQVFAGASLAATAALVGTLVTALRRPLPSGGSSVDTIKTAAEKAKKLTAAAAKLGFTRLWQGLVIAAGLVVVGIVLIVLLGQTVAVAFRTGFFGDATLPPWLTGPIGAVTFTQFWMTAALGAALLAATFLLDQTSLGLHPFYRSRMATAFAVRRLAGDDGVEAVPYLDTERTSLAVYGLADKGLPRTVHCASAHFSGQDVVPPGRRAASFTFDGDWVGSPQLGWYRADPDKAGLPRRYRQDLTLQSAMALAGGAFASAMGRHSTPMTVLLALSNARLGAWLPNPAHVVELDKHCWYTAPVPRIRNLGYLVREVFGRYPLEDPLVYIADGGHYENLGLVELLRRRCRTIVCLDAGGDDPLKCTGLAEAVALAREELGVTVEFDHPERLLPGSGEAPKQWTSLKDRIATTSVVTGRVRYPDLGPGLRAAEGLLVFAKAILEPDTPWEVLSYATSHPDFPNDSTGDQWFEHDQFDAYQTLGRHVGAKAARALHDLEHPEQPTLVVELLMA